MSPILLLVIFLAYFSMLFIIAHITSQRATNETYFTGNRQSPWYVVAYGMMGASLSGVTFISIPGEVGASYFSYMMLVFGYLLGYAAIAEILLPMYYRLQLTSIYTYLDGRFGRATYKTGSSFFLLSRSIGSSFRVFLVINVLQVFVFDKFGVPFWLTAVIFMALIMLYTMRGGIKTIVWTDTLQTTFMLLALVVSLYIMASHLGISFGGLIKLVKDSHYSDMVVTDINHRHHWLKQFLSGAFIAIVMTGLDQDMMQKNLSVRKLRDAKKNIYLLSWLLVPVNFMFMFLGASLFIYANTNGIAIPEQTDLLFPTLSVQYLGLLAGITFIIGLIAAAFSSADGSLAALTTAFSIDILGIRRKGFDEARSTRIRKRVHWATAVLFVFLVVLFREINDESVISKIFTIAGYTYGPLLGLYSFGLFTKRTVRDNLVPYVAILSPIICYILSVNSKAWFNGYVFGFELLLLNGLLTFLGLLLISRSGNNEVVAE